MTTATQVKLCECGCGAPTKLAARTDIRRGLAAGEPTRFLRGHRPGNHHQPPDPDGPPCRRENLKGPVCRAVLCRRPMHRQRSTRRCRKGHAVHAVRGICQPCAARIRRGFVPVELGPIEQPRMRPDEVLDEWEWMRGTVRWRDFHEKVGLSRSGWDKIFRSAAERGDPRAVKHPDDEPVRHWRLVDPEDREKVS